MKVTCKKYVLNICNKLEYKPEQKIFVSVIDSLLRFADGVNSAHKGIIEKHTKSGGIHDWAKEKLSLYQSS